MKNIKTPRQQTRLRQINLIHVSSGYRCAPKQFLMKLLLSVLYNQHKHHIMYSG